MIKIIHITDTHLFADARADMVGIRTEESLADILEHISRFHSDASHLVVTGDLSQDESLRSYERLAEHLAPYRGRLSLIPGNHDNLPFMRQVFPDLFTAPISSLSFSVQVGDWQLIGLDSHLPGSQSGEIGTAQLGWLSSELQAASRRHTIVFVHHPPIPVGVQWIDWLSMENPKPFLRVLDKAPNVRTLLCGHVHQEFEVDRGHYTIRTTPSTNLQFNPGEKGPERFDTLGPGLRIIELEVDNLKTCVERIDAVRHQPARAGGF